MRERNSPPIILARQEHPLSRSRIDPDALWIMRKLKRAGFMAYLVGGAVRDILLGREPKDFDVATDATPSELKSLFSNSRIIGRRFRIVHVFFKRKGEGEKIVEVSTFRADRPRGGDEKPNPDDVDQTGSAFGTPEEDAWRRDFTVNALFYNMDDFTVIDHTGGLSDLEKRTVRLIGEPAERFEEDPVRMLRAIEFAVRLGFRIADETREGISRNAPRIAEASPARLREELRQMHQRGITGDVLAKADELGLFEHIFPGIEPGKAMFGLLRHIDKSPLYGGSSGEYAYIAALAVDSAHRAAPLAPETSLEEAHDAVYPKVGEICDRYQISAHIRHMARELIVCCYRLSRGRAYKSKGKFSRRAEFAGALDFYSAWTALSGEPGEAVAYWNDYLSDQSRERQPGERKKRRKRRPRRRPKSEEDKVNAQDA